jgi:D-sedoheptulose 7-phosphate isomerase
MSQQAPGAGSVEALYPFLYADRTDVSGDASALLEQVRLSTVAKAQEIIELRRAACARYGSSLAACAAELAGRFAAGARPLPALGLASDPSVLTALANDVGPEVVFARQLAALGRPADIAIGLSTSGNSENLLRAFDAAAALGMLTVGIAGYQGGRMAELGSIDYLFVAPSASVHRIQEAQTTMYHALWELCQAALGPGAS